MRRTKSAGTVDPPDNTERKLDRSRVEKSGCSIRAMSMVGTPPMTLAPSVSMSSSTRPGSNISTGMWVALAHTLPSAPSTQPPVWNRGMGLSQTSPSCTPMRSAVSRALLTMPRWCR